MSEEKEPRPPVWFAILLVLLAVPSLLFTYQAIKVTDSTGWLTEAAAGYLFPAYIIISAVGAWMCYPSRRTISWVLVGLLVLGDLGLAGVAWAVN